MNDSTIIHFLNRALALVLFLAAGAFTPLAPAHADTSAPQVIPVSSADDRIRFFGRTLPVGNAMAFDWSLSGFEFEADCEGKVLATITGTPGWQKAGFIQVTVDGVAGERVAIEPGRQDYLLADALPKGRHKITVCKLSEAQYSKMALESLTLSGTLLAAPAPAALKMEFIGDSITCAEGALGKMPDVPQGESQDAARSFASLTARSLGAEASIVAASSWGLHRGRIAPEEKSVIPAIYELTSRFRDPSAAWDFTKYQPDLVVVNLGTNDFSGRKKAPFTDEEFQEAIERFHRVLRSRYPAAHIFWVTGMMLPDADGPTLAAVEKIRASDAKTYFAKLPQNNGGGNGHPDLDGHEKAAAALTAKIREFIPNLAESAPGR